MTNGTCRFLVFDFDNHEKNAEKRDFVNTDDTWIEEVEAMRDICTLNGIEPLVERSRSGKGAHIWIFFDKPISAAVVRKFGLALLDKGAEQVNLKSFNYYDRMLPAQDSLENVAIGNLIALPLQGRALKDGNSAFVDSNWNAYPDQWNALLSKPKLSEEFLENKIREWIFTADDLEASSDEENREKPWDRMKNFAKSDVDGKMDITLSNGIYVDSTNFKPAMQNKIRRMAAFSNPVFYKNRAIGTSNYDTSRWIYLGKDHLGGYIQIPRGLQDELIANIDKAGIEYTIDDERQQGRNINVEFNGELRPEQNKALKELTKHDNGILHAATAFGKTVVCSAVIAEKKVNTLILLESSALIEQWKDALNKFLIIDEELPQYKTKTGRLRTRKSLIGTLQGAHDSMTGIIDIAMAGSLCKKGECHEFIMALPDGYDTIVGSAGGHLSGGERQRISIARAMLKNAPIIILDEATAYTDPENEALIQHSVAKLIKGKTLIVIAHRLSTIVDADQIFVIENGTVAETGTHNELLANGEIYSNMWRAHMSVKDSEQEVEPRA